MATKSKKQPKTDFSFFNNKFFVAAFSLIVGVIGTYALTVSHAAGGSAISVVSDSTDGSIHYANQIKFNWSTTYKNSNPDTYFNPNIEVVCYQNGKWTGMGHVYRMSVSPTPNLALTGSHNYTFAEGDLNRIDYAWYTSPTQFDQTKPETCRAALYHFSKGNNKYSEMASTNFVVNP